MRLTSFSDYALRMLMYVASARGRRVTVEEAARALHVSRTHLNKVASMLTHAGFLNAARGRAGGLTLALRPEEIRIGDVIRLTEPDFALVECLTTGNQCVLTRACRLQGVLVEAAGSFQSTLDRYTLGDIALRPEDFEGGARPARRHEGIAPAP